MNYSDFVKAMLLASIHELAEDSNKYAVNPGRDFSRNRKISFEDLLLMLLTMEADCIKEELYRFFGRSTNTPSKAAFYKQRKKLRDDALRLLLLSFNQKCKKNLFKGKYSLVACDGSSADIFRNPDEPDTFLNQTPNPQRALTRSISMPFILSLTKNLLICSYSPHGNAMSTAPSASLWTAPSSRSLSFISATEVMLLIMISHT